MKNKELFSLHGKVALVTGAARGFGKFFSIAMAEAGADLVCADKDGKMLLETVHLVENLGQSVLGVEADVSDPENVEKLADQILKKFNKLDIAVNNAGIIHKPYSFHNIPLDEWQRVIAVDLSGVFLCMQKEIRIMIKQNRGSIINIASVAGLIGSGPSLMPRASYVAAKHGVIGLTKQAALEYAQNGIRVNVIAPGWFEGTDITRERLSNQKIEISKERDQKVIELTPMKRRGQLAELKGILLYLASNASSFTTGQTFVIDGGWTAQ
ncbi:MAG: SDR family oxidoreductase [Deltaproteobacteria bacterium]|nr:SDR family oxidoreductase [Deltaproteobacteria bacterium]